MSKKPYYIVIGLILVAILVVIGVFNIRTNAEKTSIKAELIVKSNAAGFEFWELVKKGALEGAKEQNVELTISGPQTEEDVDGQIRLLLEAMERKPDVIILAPVDQQKLYPYAQKIIDNDIKLVFVDSSVNTQIGSCFVGTDNFAGAQAVAEYMAQSLHKKGEIAVIAHQMSASTSIARIDGFENIMRKYPEITIIGEYDIGDSVQKSYQQTMQILKENPKLDGIYATNQISAEGVSQALMETGRYHDVQFFSFDSSTVQNSALEKGVVKGFMVQMPFNMGYMSIEAAVAAHKNKVGEYFINTGFTYVTKETMREEEVQKLIYPFV
ncbi:MAG: substrate-binding domain-containing protein [Christensenellaceae bacterium]